MKKIILGLFIILFCFSIGIAELQEKELSKEEKVKAELDMREEIHLNTLNQGYLEKLSKEELISEILMLKELFKLKREEIKLHEELVEMYEEEKKEKKFAWLDEIPDLTKKEEDKKELSLLDKWEEEDRLKKIEEENDRLEDLTGELERIKRDIESERYALELDMISHRWSMFELSSRLKSDLLFNSFLSFPFGYRYEYPTYSTKTYRTNYEPSLFSIWALSPGKKDWIKYWRLKLLLQNR